jgi:hypothetical protein
MPVSPMLPLLLGASTSAAAAAVPVDQPADSPDQDTAPPRVRTGIVIGLSLGGGLAGASGYPNSQSEIGNPDFYSASGFMGGTSGTLFVMGALTDYLNFGVWFGSAMFRNGDWKSNGGAGGLRVEAFPLVSLFPPLGGLAAFGDFGIGGANLTNKANPLLPEASGTQAYIGAGTFYEWGFGHLFGGHFGLGPSLEYDAMWSQPFERHGLVASLRIVFYGGP